MSREDEEMRPALGKPFSRRAVVRGSLLGGAGLAAAALIGCGDDEEDEPAAQQQQPADSKPAAAAPAKDPDYVTLAKDDGAPYPYNYPEPETKPKPGGTMRFAVAWDVGRLDTNVSAGADAVSVATWVTNRLISMVTGPKMSKHKIELKPDLAKSWELSPDGLTYTFKLQDNLKYHNVAPVSGRAFKAADVVQHYERAAAAGVNKAFFDSMDKVSAPDDKTVVIKMKSVDVDFLVPLASKALGIYPTELYDQKLIDTKPIGTGPFIFDEAQKGQFIRLKQNPEYWEGKPLLDGAEWRIIPDTAARVAALRADQVDFANIPVTKKERETVLATKQLLVQADPVLAGITMLGLNPNTKFKDERIRQAMMLSIDWPKHIQLIQQGEGAALPGFGWPFIFDKMPTDKEKGPWWRFDIAEGKRLMAAAGLDKGLDFELVSAGGLVGAASVDSIYASFASFFKEVGVNMKVRNTDTPTFTSQYYGNGWIKEGNDAVQGWSTAPPSANGYFFNNIHSKSPTNYFGINDPELDDWAAKQKAALDPKSRKELQKRIYDKTLAKAYRIESYSNFGFTIMQPWVRFWRFNGPYIGIHSFYDWGMGSHLAWLDK